MKTCSTGKKVKNRCLKAYRGMRGRKLDSASSVRGCKLLWSGCSNPWMRSNGASKIRANRMVGAIARDEQSEGEFVSIGSLHFQVHTWRYSRIHPKIMLKRVWHCDLVTRVSSTQITHIRFATLVDLLTSASWKKHITCQQNPLFTCSGEVHEQGKRQRMVRNGKHQLGFPRPRGLYLLRKRTKS